MPLGEFFSSILNAPFFQQPIDQIMLSILIWFGWIPIAITLFIGFVMLFQNSRQGKYLEKRRNVLLSISVPSFTEQTPKAMENMFANLYGANSNPNWKEKWIIGKVPTVFSFEIVSTGGFVSFYVRCETRFRDVIEAGIYTHYPDAEIFEAEEYANIGPEKFPDDEWDLWGSELTLKQPSYFPIKTYVDFEDKMTGEIKDPLGQILELFSKMKTGENIWFQILLRPNGNDWKKDGETWIKEAFGKPDKKKPGIVESGMKTLLSFPSAITEQAINVSLTDAILGAQSEAGEEDDFRALKLTHIERQQADGVLMKIGKQGFQIKTRIVYIGRKGVFDKPARTAIVKGMLNQYSNLNLNSFGMYGPSTPSDDFFWQAWTYPGKQLKLLRAYQGRSWGIGADPFWLNTEELATLWHFPSIGVKAPLITKSESRKSEPPVSLPMTSGATDTLPTGPVQFPGEEPPSVSSEDLPPGLAVEGEMSLPGQVAMDAPVSSPAPQAPVSDKPIVPHPTPPTGARTAPVSEEVVPEPEEPVVPEKPPEPPSLSDQGIPPNLPF